MALQSHWFWTSNPGSGMAELPSSWGLLRSVEPECESPDQLLRSRVSVRPSPPLHSPLPSGMGACLHEPATPSFGTALFVALRLSVSLPPVARDARLRRPEFAVKTKPR